MTTDLHLTQREKMEESIKHIEEVIDELDSLAYHLEEVDSHYRIPIELFDDLISKLEIVKHKIKNQNNKER
jgi:exonuclease VII small subunit